MKKIILLAIVMLCITPLHSQNNSLNFDGTDDFVQLTSPLTVGTISHTIEMWVKIPTIGSGGLSLGERVGVLIGNYNSSPNFNYEIHANGQCRIWWNNGQISTFSSTDLRDNNWHHLAFVRDKAQNRFFLYIDGSLDYTFNSSGTDIALSTPPRIGGDNRNTTGGPSFHGNIDELRIWNYARTITEIQSTINTELGGTEAGLLGYYKMDIVDSSCDVVDCNSSENHGVRTGSSGTNNAPQFSNDVTFLTSVPCGAAIICTGLPVELLNFSGTLREGAIELTWTTISELNNEGFDIQRSSDGQDWYSIHFVNGNGTTNQVVDYNYLDRNPLQGSNYYRLKQTDYDRKFTYSEVISLKTTKSQDIEIYPNPTSGIVEINGNDLGQITVFNILGQMIFNRSLELGNKIDLSNHPNGIYLISIQFDGLVSTKQIIKR